jgi:4-alpha-glucanotransferase
MQPKGTDKTIMAHKRGSGILLHITSLPSNDALGNLGPGAYEFVDFLARAGQSLWQVLPLNPPSPGEGNSPYSSLSAFAGNTLLISPELLARDGWIREAPSAVEFPEDRVDFGKAVSFKNKILDEAYQTFKAGRDRSGYDLFCRESSYWLDDFALFSSLKEKFGGKSWGDWPDDIRDRHPEAMKSYGAKLAIQIEKQKFLQYLFYMQWTELKRYANKRQIEIMGDIPIYMSYQSADLWAHPEIFKLDEHKKPLFVAGVPPDYFSKTGQLWGNPVYNWESLKNSGFDWWLKRIEHNLKLFDLLRIDHFRGLVGYWEVPVGEKTAINGNWIGVPADEFFDKLREHWPSLPVIAEDLGIITADVKALIKKLDIPGMKVLLFAFGEDLPDNPYAPHNHIKNCLVYTGTHDNNTVKGWFEREATPADKKSLVRYLGHEVTADSAANEFVRMAMMSVADRIIIPIQDIMGLGAEARMNIPSTPSGNWEWRLKREYLTEPLAKELHDKTYIYGRLPKKIE